MSTIVLTGGGTAGHICPNINLNEALKKHFDKIVYIGTNGIEKQLITSQTDYEFKEISAVKLNRSNLLKNLAIPFKLSKSISEARKILKEVKPSVVFSKGGYVGLPVVISAHKLKIPVICHESDITMGLANKISSKYAVKVCTNFKSTSETENKKIVQTSSPLPLSKLSKEEVKKKLNISTNKPILLITGGSLGAKAINELIFQLAPILSKKYYIIHLVGKNNYNKKIICKDYKQIEFTKDMWTIYKASDYAISRAGANTILELLANKIPTIFIPLPKGVSRGDQIENAKYLEKNNLAKVILQNELNQEKLQNTLKILEKEAKNIVLAIKKQNFEDGTDKIINIILSNKKDVLDS